MLDFIDAVRVLTLRSKDHEPLHKRYGEYFGSRYKLFTVEGTPKSTNGGDIGFGLWSIMKHDTADATALDITRNHIEMVREAHAEGHERVLFLEDDAYFQPLDPRKEQRMRSWLEKNHEKWDIFFMGYCPWPILCSFFITRDVVRVAHPVCAHAYLLNRKGMEKLLMHTEDPRNREHHFDKIFNLVPRFRKYAVFPMISFQDDGPALYTKAMDHLGASMRFTTVCLLLEWISVFVPFMVLLVLMGVVYRTFFNKN